MEEPPETKKPIVLLIHGTFAAEEDDDGNAWWQEGSSVWSELKSRIGDDYEVASGDDVFHWSGENGERARYEAADDLLKQMLRWEHEKRPYHLIGHSHGGSVIWLALQRAIRSRWHSRDSGRYLKLDHLKSWATVGTPFLHFKGSWMGRWYGKIITALVLITLLIVMGSLAGYAFSLTDLDAPKSTAGMGFETELSNSVPVGTWIGLGSLTLLSLVAGLIFYLAMRAVRLEGRTVREENRAKNQAILDFGQRWLGLYSTQDEAINGLRTSTKLCGDIVPRLKVLDKPVFSSDRYGILNRWIVKYLLAPLYGWVVAPSGDRFIWSKLKKAVQGHDPGARWSKRPKGLSFCPVWICATPLCQRS